MSVHLPSPTTLLLPRSLILAALLVVVASARVAPLAPSHRDAVRRPCSRHHDVDTERPRECGCRPFDRGSRKQHQALSLPAKLSVDEPYL